MDKRAIFLLLRLATSLTWFLYYSPLKLFRECDESRNKPVELVAGHLLGAGKGGGFVQLEKSFCSV